MPTLAVGMIQCDNISYEAIIALWEKNKNLSLPGFNSRREVHLMIFDCHEPLFYGKCEWSVIRHFVEEYNRQNDTAYRLKECLDVKRRNTPQPEVLLVDEGRPDIVVERKSVVWPEKHVPNHKRIHRIGKRLNQEFGQRYASSPTVFECKESALPEPQSLAAALNSVCKQITDGRTRGSEPFPWRLRPFIPGFDDDTPQTGIGVAAWSEDKWSSPQAVSQERNDALMGFTNAYRKAVKHACKKFKSYLDTHRILLVQFLGDGEYLFDEDVNKTVRDIGLPPLIDEIWAAYHEWQDEENYGIGWQRLVGVGVCKLRNCNLQIK